MSTRMLFFRDGTHKHTHDWRTSQLRDWIAPVGQFNESPAYRRHRITWHVQIVAPITKNLKKMILCHMSNVICHMSCVPCHVSCVTCHLTTTLYRFSCYESPRRLGDAAAGGLVNNRFFVVAKNTPPLQFILRQFKEEPLQLEVSITLQWKVTLRAQTDKQTNGRTLQLIDWICLEADYWK